MERRGSWFFQERTGLAEFASSCRGGSSVPQENADVFVPLIGKILCWEQAVTCFQIVGGFSCELFPVEGGNFLPDT